MIADSPPSPTGISPRITRRISLAQLMALIVVFAASLAAMKAASVWLTRLVIYACLVALLAATVGAMVQNPRRSAAIGAAVFGWAYFFIVVGSALISSNALDRDEADNAWRVDGPAIEIALSLHPELPSPRYPGPMNNVALDASTGVYSKDLNGTRVPLTAGETKLHLAYDVQQRKYTARRRAGEDAYFLVLMIQGIAFALAGAALGRALARSGSPPREPAAIMPVTPHNLLRPADFAPKPINLPKDRTDDVHR